MSDLSWFYVSLSNEGGFVAGCYVKALTIEVAVAKASKLDEDNLADAAMVAGPLPDEGMDANVPEENRERLLAESELGKSRAVQSVLHYNIGESASGSSDPESQS